MSDIAEVFLDEKVEDDPVDESLNEELKPDDQVENQDDSKDEKVDKDKDPEPTSELTEDLSDKKALVTQAKDERQKRQNAVKENEALKAELEQLKSQLNKGEDKSAPDVFEDQEAFSSHLEEKVTANARDQIMNVQRDMMMEFKPDYEEKELAFFEIAKENPAMLAQAKSSPNPAKFAYEQGSKYLQYKELQDVDALKGKMRAELEQEIRAELEGKLKAKEDKSENLSPSLANARGSVEKSPRLSENPIDMF